VTPEGLGGRLLRWARKPTPAAWPILRREWAAWVDEWAAPRRNRRFGPAALARATGDGDIKALWRRLSRQPHLAVTAPHEASLYDRYCPEGRQRVLQLARSAVEHKVNLLGSGMVELGEAIDWHKDYKTGFRWPPEYFRNIDYNNPESPSDVKFPWELSRMQWLIPAAQAHQLTGDERYAQAARAILDGWIAANPYACSVNWACAMEAAMRILTWTYLFGAFGRSNAWAEEGFRGRFLCSLYLHGEFVWRHLECSDVNGNHCTADAAALVVAGLFLGRGSGPRRWQREGWRLLCRELPRQVTPDGVDFEASLPYHRLVTELFFLPALYRRRLGLDVPAEYRQRLILMARFAAACCRPGAGVPLWGDGDDARALPLGGADINDHRYLPALIGCAWDERDLLKSFSGPRDEIFWLLGPQACAKLPGSDASAREQVSAAFPQGGVYVMRTEEDHIFIDCGPVGFAGRGGHGHNDCLSFEAVLAGQWLVSDCGSYLYTASYEKRNFFRSTACHNTPRVDGQEINRFVSPAHLWLLRDDARPMLLGWECGADRDVFRGSHGGYLRLRQPVRPLRTIALDRRRHGLAIVDRFEAAAGARFRVDIPLHLAPGVAAEPVEERQVLLRRGEKEFLLVWRGQGAWNLETAEAMVSPSYGLAVPCTRLNWSGNCSADSFLAVCIVPSSVTGPQALSAAGEVLESASLWD